MFPPFQITLSRVVPFSAQVTPFSDYFGDTGDLLLWQLVATFGDLGNLSTHGNLITSLLLPDPYGNLITRSR